MKIISDLKDSVTGILSGVDLSNVSDVYGCFERSVSTMIQKAKIPEATGIQNITLYSGVTDYLCDTHIYGNEITDIRPQGISRNASNFVTKNFPDDFDRNKGIYTPIQTTSAFEYQNGQPIIKILSPYPKQKVNLDPMTDITGWVVGGSVTNLVKDVSNFYQTPASMRFVLNGASSGTLTKTISTVDLNQYQNVGVAFLAIEIPPGATATDLTNITLKIGSDSTNYNNITATSGFLGSWVSGNWLIVSFDFSGIGQTGTPNWSKITYLQVGFTHSASITNFRTGGLWISMPTPAQICYQSPAIFLPLGSDVATIDITADTDRIILSNPAYNIYLHECVIAVLENTGAGESDASSVKINQILHGVRGRNGAIIQPGLYDLFKGDNPSQSLRQTGSWYEN
jgi:hypothetical protein